MQQPWNNLLPAQETSDTAHTPRSSILQRIATRTKPRTNRAKSILAGIGKGCSRATVRTILFLAISLSTVDTLFRGSLSQRRQQALVTDLVAD